MDEFLRSKHACTGTPDQKVPFLTLIHRDGAQGSRVEVCLWPTNWGAVRLRGWVAFPDIYLSPGFCSSPMLGDRRSTVLIVIVDETEIHSGYDHCP
jgi:hypothetical protein